MSIGLYDADMLHSRYGTFKIEILKLSAYFKKQREIVSMPIHFQPDRFTTNYFYQDIEDNDLNTLLTRPNVFYGGRAFNQGFYVPLKTEQEECVPDTSIYLKFLDEHKVHLPKGYVGLWNRQLESNHLRLSLNGKDIWENYYKQLKPLVKQAATFIHDYNLAEVNNWHIFLQQYHKQFPLSKVHCAYPLTFTDEKNLEHLLDIPNIGITDTIINTTFFPSCQLLKELEQCKYSLNIAPLSSPYEENDFTMRLLPEIFYKALFLKINCPRSLLSYRDDFFPSFEPLILMRAITCFVKGGGAAPNMTLRTFVKKHTQVPVHNIPIKKYDQATKWLYERNPEFMQELSYMTYNIAEKEGVYDIRTD